MADKEHRSALLPRNFVYLSETFPLKFRIADGQYLIDHENLRLEMSGDGESEPDIHARRITLYWSIQKSFNSRKGDDLVELPRDLLSFHAKNCAIQKDIFPPRELGMKARSDLQQATDASAHPNPPLRRLRDSTENL